MGCRCCLPRYAANGQKAIPDAESTVQTPHVLFEVVLQAGGGLFIKCRRIRGETWVDEGVTMAFIPKKALQENSVEIFLVPDLFSFWFIFPPSAYHGNTLHLPFSPLVEIYVFLFRIVGLVSQV